MTFLAPTFLFALGAVAAPVLIHLLNKTRVQRVRWAAARFLNTALQRNRRRLQLEDLLLLFLRCLLIALLALAFARPAFRGGGLALGAGGGATTAVIVLDQTASMGQGGGTDNRFTQAGTAARQILDNLPPGSAAALFLAADRTARAVPKPTADLALVRRTLEAAPASARGGDLLAGIADAAELLKPLSGRREIFILTDGQAAAWRQLDKIKALRDGLGDATSLRFVIIGGKTESNLALSALKLESSVPAVGQPARCLIEVKNTGVTAVQNIRVTLAVDGEPPLDEAMIPRIEPAGTAGVTLFARFREPGHHTLTAALPPDALASDNRRSVALLALDQLRALVVEGTTPADPSVRDGLFLANALAPVSPADFDKFYLKPVLASPAALESPALGEADLVVLTNVPRLSPRASAALAGYVARGGALLVFPGPATDPDFYNTDPAFSALLPARLDPAEDAPGESKTLSLAAKNLTHPVTALWNDPESGNLGGVQLTRYFPLKPVSDSVARTGVLLRFADGRPAFLVHSAGRGRVALFAGTGTTEWTNLPVHGAFVPLLHRLVAFLTQHDDAGLALAPGQAFTRQVPPEFAGKDFSVIRPGDTHGRLIAGRIESAGDSARLRFTDTELPGPYALFAGDEAKPLVTFAVQADPAESDLAPAPAGQLSALLNPEEAGPLAAGSESGPAAPGRELWPWLAAAALALALAETALAHRFSQAK